MIRRMSRKYRWVRKDSLSVVGVDVVDAGCFGRLMCRILCSSSFVLSIMLLIVLAVIVYYTLLYYEYA